MYKNYIKEERFMGFRKQCSFSHPNFVFFLVIFLFALFGALAYMPYLTWGQGRSLGFRGLVPPPESKKKMFKGKVVLVDLPLIKVKDSMWRTSKVFVGPPAFLKEQGFLIRIGQRLIIWSVPVKVEGSEVLAAFEIEDIDTGRKMLLRNEKGEPVWWGGNARSGTNRNRR
jgi:hypothetical protein